MSGAPLDRGVRFLVMAWMLVTAGAVVLFFGYDSIPGAVVLYRPPWADAPITGTKSFFTVGRIVLMGVGQLGAATAMVFASHGSAPWEHFWRWLGLTAGLKTLLECLTLLVPPGSTASRVLTVSTFAVVGVFAASVAWWWRRGGLRAHPAFTAGPLIGLLASLALWAVFSVSPLLLTAAPG